jgi:hypothetical protein
VEQRIELAENIFGNTHNTKDFNKSTDFRLQILDFAKLSSP